MKTSTVTVIIGDSSPGIFSSTEVNGIISKLIFSTLYLAINEDSSY